MATPPPPQQPAPPLAHIKTAARKLPVKRRTPDSSHTVANTGSSSAAAAAVKLEDPPVAVPFDNGADAADDAEDDEDEVEGDEAEPGEGDDGGGGGRAGGGAIPFKFQRIWSESDEIRFLQGLLACHAQGMTFPRDLNLYFDRFSETMSQPYTRSQLSEKLRRLRKKFRAQSARVARGVDPSALPPHDRDLFHLSTLLWDPAFAASSPFGSSHGSVPGNKRRRHIPIAGATAAGGSAGRARPSALPCPPHPTPAALPPPQSTPAAPPPPPRASPPPAPPDFNCDGGVEGCNDHLEEKPPLQQRKLFIGSDNEGLGHLAAKAALDVFDSCLQEVRATLVRRGLLHPDQTLRPVPERDLSKRWREQRVVELDVLARRLRLALEQAVED